MSTIVNAHAEWLATSTMPKLFVKAELVDEIREAIVDWTGAAHAASRCSVVRRVINVQAPAEVNHVAA